MAAIELRNWTDILTIFDVKPKSAKRLRDHQPTPLYHQIYLVLRDAIQNKELAFDDVLPGEAALARQYNVSRITAKRALDQLARDGLVERKRGLGTVVRFNGMEGVRSFRYVANVESIKSTTAGAVMESLGHETVSSRGQIGERLGLTEPTELIKIMQHSLVSEDPVLYMETYFHPIVTERLDVTYVEKGKLRTDLLQEAGFELGLQQKFITSVAADPFLATRLDIEIGSPVTKISTVIKDVTGQPLALIVVFLRPDRHEYEFVLRGVTPERS